jgi:hypothetical protein
LNARRVSIIFPRAYARFLAWFTRPDSPVPLGWFRIAVALFCFADLLAVGSSFVDVYGQYGFVQWAITRANLYGGLPHLGDVALLLKRFGLTADQSLYAVLGLYVVALCGLLVGWWSRLMAIVAWCIHFLLMHAGGGLIYGMDIFTHIALFYCMVMPVGDYLSLDAYAAKLPVQPSVAAGLTRRMLQLHMCLIYLSAGFEKAAGGQWWNGEAMWRSLMLPAFRQFDMSWLANAPWAAMLMGWSTMALEIGYTFLIWWPKTRRVWLVLVLGMHLSIGLFLGMWLFGIIMIILNLCAFGYDALRDGARRAIL